MFSALIDEDIPNNTVSVVTSMDFIGVRSSSW